MQIAITTAPRAITYLDRTIASVKLEFCSALLVFAEPGSILPDGCEIVRWESRRGPLGNLVGAAQYAAELGGDWLFLQDDCILSRNLAEYLAGGFPDGWCSPYCQTPQHRETTGWHLQERWCGGAVAYLLRESLVRRFADDPPEWSPDRYAADSDVLTWIRSHDVPFWLHSPSLVQHIGQHRAIGYTGTWRGQTDLPLDDKRTAVFCEDCRSI